MEVLTDNEIKAFLALDVGYRYGYGDGYGCGSGSGDGYGDGYCCSNGYGNGCGSGSGNGYGDGYGYGYGYGKGSGDGCGCSNGKGSGDGCGCSSGKGSGDGIKEINNHRIFSVDDVNTVIVSIRGNVAQGYIIERNTKLVPCYIVKANNKFAHGSTLRDAFTSLHEKLYDNSTEEERIETFKNKFPSYDTKYNNRDLFSYHHILTGSCLMGRKSFVNSKGLFLDDKTTVREFVELTKNTYGGNVIKKLPKAYGVTD